MRKDEIPSAGAVVEVEHAGDTVLALVCDVDHRGRLHVVTRNGDTLTLSPAKLVTVTGHTMAVPASSEVAAARTREFGEAVAAAQAEIDLETIWQLVGNDEPDPMTPGDLALLWFDDDGPASTYAMLRALRDDAVFFKRTKDDRFALRSAREVDAARQQALGEQRREDVFQSVVEAIAGALSEGGAQAAERLRDDHVSRPFVELIADFAASGDAFDRRDEAVRLLEALASRPDTASSRATPLGAFELLARVGLAGEHENLALRRYRIRTDYDDGLLGDAEALAASLADLDLSALVSRPDCQAITIDDARTRDLDDALDVRLEPGGGCEIGIHISDVAALVRPGSPLDVEAQKRGSSVYLPTGVIPMFPPVLSEEALSLVAGERRPVLSFRVRFDAENRRLGARLEMATLTVRERLTYEEADAQLERGEGPWAAQLLRLESVAQARAARRVADGAFDIDLPDVDVKVVDGEPVVTCVPRTRSRALVSELMVLAGDLAASYCLDEGIPTVFRTQDTVVEAADRERAEAIEEPLARDFERARLLRRGELRSEAARHRGLGLDTYVQATSPIRRYADLVVHYQLREHLLGRAPVFGADEMVALAARAESAASDCVAAQRDTDRYWLLEYLRRQDHPVVEAVVLNHDPSARRATVPVVLPGTMLRTNLGARGLAVGQHVSVKVVKADPRRDLLQVALAG